MVKKERKVVGFLIITAFIMIVIYLIALEMEDREEQAIMEYLKSNAMNKTEEVTIPCNVCEYLKCKKVNPSTHVYSEYMSPIYLCEYHYTVYKQKFKKEILGDFVDEWYK